MMITFINVIIRLVIITVIVMTSPAGRAVLEHVVHGLVHGPALGVHPRVHHQAARAEYVLTQVTKPVLEMVSTPQLSLYFLIMR